MMNMEEMLDTYHDQAINTSVLHLPFNNSYSMLLLLPDDMATLENVICPAHITKWLKWMKPRWGSCSFILSLLFSTENCLNVKHCFDFSHHLQYACLCKSLRMYDVYVPKFSIKSSYLLNNVLKEMGMTHMFGDSADLSGISEGQKLAVSEVRTEYTVCHGSDNFFTIVHPPFTSLSSSLYWRLCTRLLWMLMRKEPLQQLPQASALPLCPCDTFLSWSLTVRLWSLSLSARQKTSFSWERLSTQLSDGANILLQCGCKITNKLICDTFFFPLRLIVW